MVLRNARRARALAPTLAVGLSVVSGCGDPSASTTETSSESSTASSGEGTTGNTEAGETTETSGTTGSTEAPDIAWEVFLPEGATIRAIRITSDGDVVVTGSLGGDLWLARYDGDSGAQQWSQTYDYLGGPESGVDLVVADDGTVYVAATAWTGEDTPNCDPYYGCPQWQDMWVVAAAPDGTHVWDRIMTMDQDYNEARSIVLGNDGLPTAVAALFPAADQGATLQHFNADGSLMWEHTIESYASAADLTADAEGNLYIADARQQWIYALDPTGTPTWSADLDPLRLDDFAFNGSDLVGVHTSGDQYRYDLSGNALGNFAAPPDIRAQDLDALPTGESVAVGSRSSGDDGPTRIWARGSDGGDQATWELEFNVGEPEGYVGDDNDIAYAVAMFDAQDVVLGGSITQHDPVLTRGWLAQVVVP